MVNSKNKSNYLLYAILAIVFICGVFGVIAFVLEMTGKSKTPKTTGKRSVYDSVGLDSLPSMTPEAPSIDSYLKTIQSTVEENKEKIDKYLNDGFKEKINKISSNSYRIKDMIGQIPSSWAVWDDGSRRYKSISTGGTGGLSSNPAVVKPSPSRWQGDEPEMEKAWPSTT